MANASRIKDGAAPSALKVGVPLGALSAGVPHFGFDRNPLRIDYVIQEMSDVRVSIRLDFTDIGSYGGKTRSAYIGSYVMEIENRPLWFDTHKGSQYSGTFYKGAQKEEKLVGPVSFSLHFSLIPTIDNPERIMKEGAIELLVNLAELLHETPPGGVRPSPAEHLRDTQTAQVLAVIHQAAVDKQGTGWLGTAKRGND